MKPSNRSIKACENKLPCEIAEYQRENKWRNLREISLGTLSWCRLASYLNADQNVRCCQTSGWSIVKGAWLAPPRVNQKLGWESHACQNHHVWQSHPLIVTGSQIVYRKSHLKRVEPASPKLLNTPNRMREITLYDLTSKHKNQCWSSNVWKIR